MFFQHLFVLWLTILALYVELGVSQSARAEHSGTRKLDTEVKTDDPDTKQQEEPGMDSFFDPTVNTLNSFNVTNEELQATVDCATAAYACTHNPLMDSSRCAVLIKHCNNCARFETRDSPEGKHVLCAVINAQTCYNAAFSFGTTLTSNDTLGYSCAQARQTCEQVLHVPAKDLPPDFVVSAVRGFCEAQLKDCLMCQAEEKRCRFVTEDVALDKMFCSARAVSCFHDAMTNQPMPYLDRVPLTNQKDGKVKCHPYVPSSDDDSSNEDNSDEESSPPLSVSTGHRNSSRLATTASVLPPLRQIV